MNAPIRRRVRARRCAVQALYQWQLAGLEPGDIVREFVAERELIDVDFEYFSMLTREIPGCVGELDKHLEEVLDRPLRELGPVERGVLWIGVYELKFCPDMPWRVVIDEAIELAKMFGPEQAYRYVNGVLDRAVRFLRPAECGASGAV
jgi:N utilization substance protein B